MLFFGHYAYSIVAEVQYMTHASTTLDTISFARCGKRMSLKPSERVRLIIAAAAAYRPVLLVTAGYAVHSRKHLRRLARQLAASPSRTTIITEVHFDGRSRKPSSRSHAMWAVHADGTLYRFGRQAFGTSAQARDPANIGLPRFLTAAPARKLYVGTLSVFALCCGELNIVHGRNEPHFLDEAAGRHLLAARIIVNPTHDRMSNAGTLQSKRSFLSQPAFDGAARAYVSCSNWEECDLNGKRQYPSASLHTVYVSGAAIPYDEPADGNFGFVYRRWQLPLD